MFSAILAAILITAASWAHGRDKLPKLAILAICATLVAGSAFLEHGYYKPALGAVAAFMAVWFTMRTSKQARGELDSIYIERARKRAGLLWRAYIIPSAIIALAAASGFFYAYGLTWWLPAIGLLPVTVSVAPWICKRVSLLDKYGNIKDEYLDPAIRNAESSKAREKQEIATGAGILAPHVLALTLAAIAALQVV